MNCLQKTWKQRFLFLLIVATLCENSPSSSLSHNEKDGGSFESHHRHHRHQRQQQDQHQQQQQGQCRDREGLRDPPSFNQRSCALCYHFLFPRGKGKPLVALDQYLVFITNNSTAPIVPDPFNSTSVDLVCSALNGDECQRWIGCCMAAVECCQTQLATPPTENDIRSGGKQTYCNRTWDGYSCWEDTPAGVTSYVECPFHLDHSLTTKSAVKTCTVNGTWLEKAGHQWTDYRPCIDKQAYLIGAYVCFGCNAVGILLLVPAICIFCKFRELLKQHRIRIHINFFASLVLSSSVMIVWYYLVHYDLLVNPVSTETVLHRNPVWCRILSYVKIYSTSATYFWMFNEGFYLHRLITHTFEPPKSLRGLCLYGWLMPILGATIYGIIRGALANDRCWTLNFGDYEWVIYAPNFFCMVLNSVFLSNILRILMFRLHSHPHEPSNFRRGVKAAFMLIPLFGIQLFLTIYRPPKGMQTEIIYECVFLFTTNSQGIFVSLVYCFFNSEVLSRLPFSMSCCCCSAKGPSSPRSRGVSTQLTHITLGDMRRSLSNMAFYPGSASPQNGRLLTTGSFVNLGGQPKQPSPTSCQSLSPGGVLGTSPDPKRKSSSLSTNTEIEHVDQKSPDSPPKYASLFSSAGQRAAVISPGKGQAKYSALPTAENS